LHCSVSALFFIRNVEMISTTNSGYVYYFNKNLIQNSNRTDLDYEYAE